ncbi:MAG TPA: hydroxymethylbilane synthase [Rhodothermales bacterium]|nr:hydroxymethylbilane synthase [Rhodothermales bacterium]
MPPESNIPLVLGTRASALALWQARFVKAELEQSGYDVHLQELTTKGDRILDVPLADIGDKGLFTKELDLALLQGRIHLAVHSLKDLPTRLPEGITLAAVTEREEPWDAFVPHPDYERRLEDLPEGAVIGTSSLRRQAQLKAWRPDLRIVSVRGNVDTRLAKLDASDWHGLILATAGLVRLGMDRRIGQRIDPGIMLPAVGQGALGVVCAEMDTETIELLQGVLHHGPTAWGTQAERAFLRRLEGGCQVPIGAHARLENDELVLDGCVAAEDGTELYRGRRTGSPEHAEALGTQLAEILLERGAGRILQQIRTAHPY